jgi:hypothetical protein
MFIEKSFGRHDYAFKSLLSRQYELRAMLRPWDPAGYTRLEAATMILDGGILLQLFQDAAELGRWSPAGPTLAAGLSNRVPAAYLSDAIATVLASDARALAAALRVVAARLKVSDPKYAALAASLADFADASGGFSIAG